MKALGARAKSHFDALMASEGYRRLLRWAALPVTDRRWAAPLAAIALGFGLFVGVALGPGTTGTLATNVAQVVQEVEPAPSAEESAPPEEEGEGEEEASEESGEGSGGFEEEESFEEAGFEFAEAEPEAEESEPFEAATPPAEPEEEEAAPTEPEPEPVSGTVLQTNPAAGSYTLVEAEGTPVAVHAKKLPQPGTKVSVPVLVLANGTLAEEGKRKTIGKQTEATFNGTVSFVDPDPAAPAYTVSKRGVSVLVRVPPDPSGAVPVLPAIGAYATVAVEIAKPAAWRLSARMRKKSATRPVDFSVAPEEPVTGAGCAVDPAALPASPQKPGAELWQRQLDAEGTPFTFSDFAGIVTAVCPEEGKLLLSADESRASEADVAFTVPRKIQVKSLKLGESVLATATIEADGSLTLTGLAGDEGAKGADDAKATQGDLVNHNQE